MNWNRGPTIGRGSTATVSVATSAATGESFAVKSAELSLSSSLQREKQLLSQLSSPYIVQYKGDSVTFEDNKQIYNLLIEYMPGGTVSDAIRKSGGSLDEHTIKVYTHEILQGLNYLHNYGISHCDIKGSNLLIGENGVKIADLGCAKCPATSAFSGTPAYMSPEVARGEEQGFPADVWALGCTVIEMATGSHPWAEEDSPVSALYRVGISGDVPETPENFSDKARDFLKKCLVRDPRERFTAKQLLEHSFFDDLELINNKFGEFCRISPTCVLDQDFWDSVESQPSSSHVNSGLISPTERIKGLIGSSNLNWDEEDWINVRVSEYYEEIEIIEEQINGEIIVNLASTEYSTDGVDNTIIDCVLIEFLILCKNVWGDNSDTFYVISNLGRKLMNISFLLNSCLLLAFSSHRYL